MNTIEVDIKFPMKGRSYLELLNDAEKLLKMHRAEAALERMIEAGKLVGEGDKHG